MSTPAPNLALKDLASLVGDDAAREIVRLFLSSFPESVRSLGQGSRQDQMRIVHGLRSSALHMGADRLSQRISELEEKLAQPGATLEAGDLDAAVGEFEEFAADLRRYAEP
ncbi:MAG TPA: Hpt domain-containing protein [Opitutaceae bacterium]|nr:Hpt domain-containing protein [Opitutaceae bacterium]